MSERSPVPPAGTEEAPPALEKPKQPSPMKVWFMKAIIEDPEVKAAVMEVLASNEDALGKLVHDSPAVRRAIRAVCVEDILSVADKAPAPNPRTEPDLLPQLRQYLRRDAFRSPYGIE